MTTTAHDTTHINPTTWNQVFRYDQAQLRPAPTQVLTLAGQGAVDRDGALLHDADTAGQLGAAMDNVVALLATVGMDLTDVFRMVVYTTDLDGAFAGYDALTTRLDAAGATPPCTLLGVERLAVPGMTVEIDVTAGR